MGLDETMSMISGSERLGVLSSQMFPTSLLPESGDWGGSGDAAYVVCLPDLELCRLCDA